MDIRKATPKFLFSLAKNFIALENITYEDTEISYFNSYDTSEYSDQIFRFLKDRGFTKVRRIGIDKFFYVFIKENKDYLFDDTPITDYSVLVIPKIKKYKFDWEIVETKTIDMTYEHTSYTYLDMEDAEEEIMFERDQGNIYAEEGVQTKYEEGDSYVEQSYITKFRKD